MMDCRFILPHDAAMATPADLKDMIVGHRLPVSPVLIRHHT